jgi:protein-tyrosine phosphatase
MGEIAEMIDLHNHILPGLDDGAEVLEESIEMCRISFRDGIRTVVATPHILPGIYENNRPTILAKVHELNEAIKKFGVRSSGFGVKNLDPITQLPNDSITELEILPGADIHFSFDLLQRYENGEIVAVNDLGRYLMVEFEFQGIPYKAEEALFQLLTKGIVPIISHPERNFEIGHNPKRYYEMIRMGCLGQVTAMSLTGEFGPEIRQIAEKLFKKRLIHIIASDAHSAGRRPPILSSGVKAAEKIVGKKEAQKMVTEYPQAILEGRKPDIPEPLSP